MRAATSLQKIFIVASSATVLVAGCGGQTENVDEAATTSTTPRAQPTDAPSSTPTPTPTPTPEPVGLIWSPEKAPVYESAYMTARLVAAAVIDTTDPSAPSEFRNSCLFEIEAAHDIQGTPADLTHCMAVEWSFDVAKDFPTSEYVKEGALSPGALVQDGTQIDQAITNSGRPGTKNNMIQAVYPLVTGKPGGVLYFQTGSNDQATYWAEHEWKVPGPRQFEDWFGFED